MPTIKPVQEVILAGVVGGPLPLTLTPTLYCEGEGRFRRFQFKELRGIKGSVGTVAELFSCLTCQWTRQWGARG